MAELNGNQTSTSQLETALQQIGIKARTSDSWSVVSSKVGNETHFSITLADPPAAASVAVTAPADPSSAVEAAV